MSEAFVEVQGHDADADNVGVAAFGSFIVTECVGELGSVVLVEDRPPGAALFTLKDESCCYFCEEEFPCLRPVV